MKIRRILRKYMTFSEYGPKYPDKTFTKQHFRSILQLYVTFSEYSMYPRLLKLPEKHHFFLFGARNTGKSTLLNSLFSPENSRYIDLLNVQEEDKYRKDPLLLSHETMALPNNIQHIIVDEVQKVPRLLDTIQMLMSKTDKRFIMSGSSARKLKSGGANLLAGRAFVYHLFPLSVYEIGADFSLDNALQWGTLPGVLQCNTDWERQEFLKAYAHTYLKEEIISEQIIRHLDPFHKFLEVAAQCNGKIINYSNIARDVGVNDKTIKSYYSILEDTLIGFMLEPYQGSFRKRLGQKAKFYFFDTGVARALARLTTVPLLPQTHAYGNAFEHFILLECMKLSDYYRKDYRFNYLRTANDVEIDMIIERPGLPLLCIEIKSSSEINAQDISSFKQITADIPQCEAVVLSQDKYAKKFDHVTVLPWRQGILDLFGAS